MGLRQPGRARRPPPPARRAARPHRRAARGPRGRDLLQDGRAGRGRGRAAARRRHLRAQPHRRAHRLGARGRSVGDGGLSATPRPRVVIVGAGFGRLWAARSVAKHLGGRDTEVLLVDRNNYHTFFPLLYQVAAAELAPSDIAYPVRSILRKTPRVGFRMGEVRRIDLDARTIEVGEETIGYDRLVLAPGSVAHDCGVPGAREHAFFLRWMDDAIPLRQQVLARFEAASTERDAERRRRLLTFVIVGGGPTGVEFAGALAEFVWGPARRDYVGIGEAEPRIVLLEATDRVLRTMPAHLSKHAAERLTRRGVDVRTGATVEYIAVTEVQLAGGERIPSETVVWTAGVKGDPRVA
ncbi:MAG: hypothetical protein EXR95_06155 [Gemmatimonadetes bacterium]|nr:hypothetical protein [Gemmatimonadota bacterium]